MNSKRTRMYQKAGEHMHKFLLTCQSYHFSDVSVVLATYATCYKRPRKWLLDKISQYYNGRTEGPNDQYDDRQKEGNFVESSCSNAPQVNTSLKNPRLDQCHAKTRSAFNNKYLCLVRLFPLIKKWVIWFSKKHRHASSINWCVQFFFSKFKV